MKSKEELIKNKAYAQSPLDGNLYMEDDVLAFMEAYANQDRWISVEERLPENEFSVMIYSNLDTHEFGFYSHNHGKWIIYSGSPVLPTHWQPLPNPPTP